LINDKFIITHFLVLKAINEDSPTVPTLLTDYILKGKYYVFKLFTSFIFYCNANLISISKNENKYYNITSPLIFRIRNIDYFKVGQYFFHQILVDFINFSHFLYKNELNCTCQLLSSKI